MVFLKISQNSQENTCARVYFLIKPSGLQFYWKETPTQPFSCEICEIFRNIFTEHLRWLLFSLVESLFIWQVVLSSFCLIPLKLEFDLFNGSDVKFTRFFRHFWSVFSCIQSFTQCIICIFFCNIFFLFRIICYWKTYFTNWELQNTPSPSQRLN